ncbi:hypothetical protein EX895_004689 [Sporisorium graminicola]|uniref:Uncharacterized protein n=1 Tax=Sporisorium graminicola TaxID=280036 RepID=A0A4U7KQ99_9BASI|nr:hypothetical protein EX895_004689 [Sporisorium graminicola]TKY86540.1 hypothetical protein EX895_004689 [Sporisorium graminicola]
MSDTAHVASSSTPSSVAHPPTIANHILTIPHRTYPNFLTQIVRLSSTTGQQSLFVHCTSVSPSQAHALLPSASTTTTNANEGEDAELHAALLAAGRSQPSSGPLGNLSSDFALAMSPPSSSAYATSTSIHSSSSNISLANSMSKRIATKLSLPQLLLSLDIPAQLLPSPNQLQAPADATALLALEKALRDACASTLSHSSH